MLRQSSTHLSLTRWLSSFTFLSPAFPPATPYSLQINQNHPPSQKMEMNMDSAEKKMKSNKDTSHHWIFSPLFILSVLLFFVMYSPTLWFKNVAKINEKIYICRSRDSITGKEQQTSKEMERDKKCTWWIKEQLGIKKRRQIYNLHLRLCVKLAKKTTSEKRRANFNRKSCFHINSLAQS